MAYMDLARDFPAEYHEGTYRQFLQRHELECGQLQDGDVGRRARLQGLLLRRIADARNLRCALDHLATHGGSAPGPDGLRLDELEDRERWSLVRAIGTLIRSGNYRAGRARRVKIPKRSGKGTRTLHIQSFVDRIVQRGILQILSPLLDPQFFPTSFGFRPRTGREHALAVACRHAQQQGRWRWICCDLADAFDRVPHGRLIDVVRVYVGSDDLTQLVRRTIANRKQRGLRQGSNLSPLLLNLYLHHHLDRLWSDQLPDTPLLRYADDLLLLCSDAGEAKVASETLDHLLLPAGMKLNATKTKQYVLTSGDRAEYLGFNIFCRAGGAEVSIGDAEWNRLVESLDSLHLEPFAHPRAYQLIESWSSQLGPAYQGDKLEECYRRVAQIAGDRGYWEIPGRVRVNELWQRAADRYYSIVEQATSP